MEKLIENIEKATEKYQKSVKRLNKFQHDYDTLDYDEVVKRIGAYQTYKVDQQTKNNWFELEKQNLASEIRRMKEKVEKNKTAMMKHLAKKSIEEKRNNIVLVPVIEEFLNKWEVKVLDYYNESRVNYLDYLVETQKEIDQACIDNNVDKNNYQEYRALTVKLNLDINSMYRYLKMVYPDFTIEYAKTSTKTWNEELAKHVAREKKAKKDMFYARVMEKAGNIEDADDLYIGENGEINGIVIGDKATVRVETITAGGYNIQRLHFRVLVNITNLYKRGDK